MKPIPQSALIRIKAPAGRQRKYQLEVRDPDLGKWVKYKLEAVDVINRRLKTGEINREQAKTRLRELRQLMYKERDKFKKTRGYCEYNHKVLKRYLQEKYPDRRVKRMVPNSYRAMVYYFEQALSFIPDIPLDTEITVLQDAIDKATKFTNRSNGTRKIEDLSKEKSKHARMVQHLNFLLKFLGRTETLMKFTYEKPEVTYVTEEQLNQMLPLFKDEIVRTLTALCYWTGMRYGETLLLTNKDLIGNEALNITKQLDKNGQERLPKNKKKRRIYLDKKAKFWLMRWLDIPLEARRDLRTSNRHNKLIKAAAREVQKKDDSFPNPEKLNLITMRHSRAVYLASNNLSLDIISKTLGNGRAVCERHYAGFVLTTEDESLLKNTLAKRDAEREDLEKRGTQNEQNSEIERLKAQIEQLKLGAS